jgi:hypothetical protein
MMARSTLPLTFVLLAASAAWADDLKSGPQVGDGRRGFQAQFFTGIHAGKKYCPV